MLVYFVALFLFGLGGIFTHCPDGWMSFKGSCYLFEQQKSTFYTAENVCTHYNSHLVHIDSAAENAFLASVITTHKDSYYLTGLTDFVIDGQWEWYDTYTVANFTDWYKGQPDGHTHQNCVVFVPHGEEVHWHDSECDTKFKFICEKTEADTCTEPAIVG